MSHLYLYYICELVTMPFKYMERWRHNSKKNTFQYNNSHVNIQFGLIVIKMCLLIININTYVINNILSLLLEKCLWNCFFLMININNYVKNKILSLSLEKCLWKFIFNDTTSIHQTHNNTKEKKKSKNRGHFPCFLTCYFI